MLRGEGRPVVLNLGVDPPAKTLNDHTMTFKTSPNVQKPLQPQRHRSLRLTAQIKNRMPVKMLDQ